MKKYILKSSTNKPEEITVKQFVIHTVEDAPDYYSGQIEAVISELDK